MEFIYFHKYNELVDMGIAKPLQCPLCYSRVQTVMGKDDTPALQCFMCGALTEPGRNWYDEIRSVVKEFYDV